MNMNVKEYLEDLRFGEAQSYQHICVIPLYAALEGTPPYVALADAMDVKALTVTEVSEGGSVPQLLVSNDCDQAVLIIDGEELIGAKQNRILNTSILLKERMTCSIWLGSQIPRAQVKALAQPYNEGGCTGDLVWNV